MSESRYRIVGGFTIALIVHVVAVAMIAQSSTIMSAPQERSVHGLRSPDSGTTERPAVVQWELELLESPKASVVELSV